MLLALKMKKKIKICQATIPQFTTALTRRMHATMTAFLMLERIADGYGAVVLATHNLESGTVLSHNFHSG